MTQGTTISGGLRAAVLPGGVAVLVAGLVSVGVLNGFTVPAVGAVLDEWAPQTAETTAPPVAASFSAPNDVDHDALGRLVVADFAANGVLRRDVDGTWETVAGFGTHDAAMWNPSAVVALADGRFVVAEAGRRTVAVLDGGSVRRIPAPPVRRSVSELAVDGTTVWAAVPGSGELWTADLGSGDWTTVTGPWTDPGGVALSADGSALVVTDAQRDEIWRMQRSDGSVQALGFPTTERARLLGVAVDADDSVFAVDNGGGRVWSYDGEAWTVALDAAPDGSPLANPTAVSVDGPRMAVADYNRRRVVTATRSLAAEPTASTTVVGPPTTQAPEPVPTTPAPEPTGAPTPTPVPVPTATVTPTERPTTAPVPVPTMPAPTTGPVPPTPEVSTPVAPTPGATAPTAPVVTGGAAAAGPTTAGGAATPATAAGTAAPAVPPTRSALAVTGASVAGPLVAAAVLLGLGLVVRSSRTRRNRG